MTKRYRPPETYGGIERRSTFYPRADTGSESCDVGSISKDRYARNDASDQLGSYFPGRLGLGPNWHHTIRQPRSGKNARQFAVLDHDCSDGFGPLDLDPADLQLNCASTIRRRGIQFRRSL